MIDEFSVEFPVEISKDFPFIESYDGGWVEVGGFDSGLTSSDTLILRIFEVEPWI